MNSFSGFELVVDLEKKLVSFVDGSKQFAFDVDEHRRFCLLNGFDDIGLSLRHADKIRQFETQRLLKQPWLTKTLMG